MTISINDAVLRLGQGSATLTYPLTPSRLAEIKTRKQFNYQAMLFAQEPPADPFQEGFITIISDEANAAGFADGQPFTLEPEKWQILCVELDGIVFPTFYLLRREGQIPGPLDEAMINFALGKSIRDEPLSADAEALVRQMTATILNLGIDGTLDESTLYQATEQFIGAVTSIFQQQEVQARIEKFLEVKQIPFRLQDGSYYFTVDSGEHAWHVELELLEDDQAVVLYSYVLLQIDDEAADELLRDLNHLNQTFSLGNFQFNTRQHTLYFKSHLFCSLFHLDEQLETLFASSFEAMRALFPTLKEKYRDQIQFQF